MTGWVILVDQPKDLPNAETPHKVITTSEYLARPRLFDMGRPKLVNLARSYAYQSKGYYASLLAEARGHRVVPSVERMPMQATATRAAIRPYSIAVAPEAGGSGLGKALLRAFLEQAWLTDAQCVILTTDADGNEAANALYQKVGFQHTRRFLQRQGRWMNEYVIHRVGAGDTCRMHP